MELPWVESISGDTGEANKTLFQIHTAQSVLDSWIHCLQLPKDHETPAPDFYCPCVATTSDPSLEFGKQPMVVEEDAGTTQGTARKNALLMKYQQQYVRIVNPAVFHGKD
ncbi:hypothetical protein E5288_WYG004236 [Bos mutus]|uniref:Uncharacterized protein n=1 Tax=Bos mutus TaxID=72004 RepID=A0A6B0R7X6_9CETA|nr:hypothetical protein [Bos mutus]